MNADSKGEIEELSLEAQEIISGGTGQDFDMEYWQRYYQECQETAQQSLTVDPNNPHSKEQPGKLIKR